MVLVVGREDQSLAQEIVTRYGLNKVRALVPGGKERCHSVYQGLQALSSNCSLVVVHDGVRPFLTWSLLSRAVEEAKRSGSVAVGVPVKDTIKICDQKGMVVETPPREKLWAVQTPQVFPRELLLDAYEKALEIGLVATDDAAILGILVTRLKSSWGLQQYQDHHSEDLDLAAGIWRGEGRMRVGIGYDVHPLVKDRPLVLENYP